jgi:hypothetical protein|tara:strand:- start:847 stop:1509 length:663 start_codon:yes stop_codon:yes gene_type:complete
MTKTFKDYLKEAENESGLQYYTGVKKHGKEYMKKAAKAGREGASQEELGRLKDKYSKAEKKKESIEVKEAMACNCNEDCACGGNCTPDCNCGPDCGTNESTEVNRVKELAGIYTNEETYDGDDFYNNYGDMWYNEDEIMDEAEYQGRKVKLGKPMRGDVKKFKVYVRDPKTKNIKKVNFGDPNMKIKKSNPARRRSFRARHNCDNPGPRTKARYWSCRKW